MMSLAGKVHGTLPRVTRGEGLVTGRFKKTEPLNNLYFINVVIGFTNH